MPSFWKQCFERTGDHLRDRLTRLNLEIMHALQREDRDKVRFLREQRKNVQESLFAGNRRRATTTSFA